MSDLHCTVAPSQGRDSKWWAGFTRRLCRDWRASTWEACDSWCAAQGIIDARWSIDSPHLSHPMVSASGWRQEEGGGYGVQAFQKGHDLAEGLGVHLSLQGEVRTRVKRQLARQQTGAEGRRVKSPCRKDEGTRVRDDTQTRRRRVVADDGDRLDSTARVSAISQRCTAGSIGATGYEHCPAEQFPHRAPEYQSCGPEPPRFPTPQTSHRCRARRASWSGVQPGPAWPQSAPASRLLSARVERVVGLKVFVWKRAGTELARSWREGADDRIRPRW